MADWSSYFARLEGSPISIAVDLSFKPRAPLADKPDTYTIVVALREPDENGMTVAREYRALQAIEDDLAAALQPYAIVEVGRVTGRGLRTFHYYGPHVDQVASLVGAVMRRHAEYTYRALSAADPAWAVYGGYLFPDDTQMTFAADMKALQALLDAGDDFERARPIEHTIRFDDVQRRRLFARAMQNRGYEIAVEPAANAVRCCRRDTIDPLKIAEMRTALTTLAEEFGGFYAGWATIIDSACGQ